MWVVPRSSLTEDQLHAVDLPADKHRIIVGGPGSGKTLVLAHRARRLLDHGMQPDRIRFLVYTNLLNSYLRSGLTELGIPEESVITVDKWTMDVYRQFIGGRPPVQKRAYGGAMPDYREMRLRVLKQIREHDDVSPVLDAVLIDEGQDLDAEAVELLAGLSRHVTLALDARQRLYEEKISIDEARALLGASRSQEALLGAYRCTPLIVELAAAFLPEEEAARFRASNLVPMAEREQLVLHESASESAEWDIVAKHLGKRAILGQRTAVLVRTQRQIRSAVKELTERDVAVVSQKEAVFTDDRPIVMTYHSSKGLTLDAILLPGLDAGAFDDVTDDKLARNLVFVAITRATSWVWMGTRIGQGLPKLQGFETFDDLIARGVLVRSGGGATYAPAQGDPPATSSTGGAPSIVDLL